MESLQNNPSIPVYANLCRDAYFRKIFFFMEKKVQELYIEGKESIEL